MSITIQYERLYDIGLAATVTRRVDVAMDEVRVCSDDRLLHQVFRKDDPDWTKTIVSMILLGSHRPEEAASVENMLKFLEQEAKDYAI
jgi:hypothetical protein